MTDQAALLRQSSQLCAGYVTLTQQIQAGTAQRDKLKRIIDADPMAKAHRAAKERLEKESPYKTSHVIIAFLAAMVPYALVGILQLLTDSVSNFLSFLGLAATIAVFVFVYQKQNKGYQAQLLETYTAEALAQNQQKARDARQKHAALEAQLQRLQSKLADYQSAMMDPNKCCIPQNYWYHGQAICQLVESGQARTVEEAIRLHQQQLQYQQQLAQQQQAIADAQRWNQLQNMMNSNVAAELDKKRKDQFNDALDWMVLSELIEED